MCVLVVATSGRPARAVERRLVVHRRPSGLQDGGQLRLCDRVAAQLAGLNISIVSRGCDVVVLMRRCPP